MTDGGESGRNWEEVARRKMATELQIFFDDEVTPHPHKVTHALESGDDPVDHYWTMVHRFGEFSNRVADDLLTAGDLDSSDPKVQLHSTSYYVQDRLLMLGKAIQNESVDEGLHGDSFEAARRALDDARDHVDELEEEYRGDGE